MVNPKVTSVVSSVTALIETSLSRGSSITISAPTAGVKTTRVSSQESNQCASIR